MSEGPLEEELGKVLEYINLSDQEWRYHERSRKSKSKQVVLERVREGSFESDSSNGMEDINIDHLDGTHVLIAKICVASGEEPKFKRLLVLALGGTFLEWFCGRTQGTSSTYDYSNFNHSRHNHGYK